MVSASKGPTVATAPQFASNVKRPALKRSTVAKTEATISLRIAFRLVDVVSADPGRAFAFWRTQSREFDVAQLNLMLKGYRLTTAEILYHMPDHPKLLQTFVWQELDMAPKFPVLSKFLTFWEQNLDGRLHSVRVGTCGILCPLDIRHVGHEISIH
jgi:uncharacterized protein Usg